MADRMLAGPSASLKAKLTEHARYLPSAAMRKRMPAGSGTICTVPARSACVSAEEWRRAVRATAKVFARCQITEGTRIEHEKYVVWVNTYAEIMGHGTFVVVDHTVRASECQRHLRVVSESSIVCGARGTSQRYARPHSAVSCAVLRRSNPGRMASLCPSRMSSTSR